MTCKIERWGDQGAAEGKMPGELKTMTFLCDRDGCDVSPTDAEIMAAGGLAKMGWECLGGKHFCPMHRLTPLPAVAIKDIAAERERQITIEGWTPTRDDAYADGALAKAAMCYIYGPNLVHDRPPEWWPWEAEWWKPSDYRRNLVKAGALVAAEIERIDRQGEISG